MLKFIKQKLINILELYLHLHMIDCKWELTNILQKPTSFASLMRLQKKN